MKEKILYWSFLIGGGILSAFMMTQGINVLGSMLTGIGASVLCYLVFLDEDKRWTP